MKLTARVWFEDQLLDIEYPAQIGVYYAQDDIEVDSNGAWVSYCDQDGQDVFCYNAITEERIYY